MTPHALIAQFAQERRRRRLSARALARAAGTATDTVMRLEEGRGGGHLATAAAVAAALGMRIVAVPDGEVTTCRACRFPLPSHHFGRDLRRADGKASCCIACKADGRAVIDQFAARRTGRGRSNSQRAAERLRNQTTYTRFRDGGLDRYEAAKAVGLTTERTRQRYERAYRDSLEAAA